MTRNDKATRPLVMKAFRKLRKLGFVARANYMCCGTCASHACFEDAEETGKDAVAWWHRQDEENYRETGELYVGFGAVKDVDDTTTTIGDEVGRTVAKTLLDTGLVIDWSGSSHQRIRVIRKG